MDVPALRDLLNTNRLYKDEREELISLLGRVARLEVVEADARALVEVLPADVSQIRVEAGHTRRSVAVKGAIVKVAARVRE